MSSATPRLFAALPDAITASIFLVAWIAPTIPGPHYVSNLTLTMLMEFIVMHSSAFYAGICASSEISRSKRVGILGGLSAIYLTFILGFALAYQSAWPIFAFAWLFASRFIHIWTHPLQDSAETKRMMLLWLASALAYVFGAGLTAMLPLPHLGITPEFVASMHLSGSGEWVERPYTVIAFGALYFGVLAWVKYGLAGVAVAPPDTAPDSPGARRIVAAVEAAMRGKPES